MSWQKLGRFLIWREHVFLEFYTPQECMCKDCGMILADTNTTFLIQKLKLKCSLQSKDHNDYQTFSFHLIYSHPLHSHTFDTFHKFMMPTLSDWELILIGKLNSRNHLIFLLSHCVLLYLAKDINELFLF